MLKFRVRVADQTGNPIAAVPFDDWDAAVDYAIMAREGEYRTALDYAVPESVIDLATLDIAGAMALIAFLTQAVTEVMDEVAETAEEG